MKRLMKKLAEEYSEDIELTIDLEGVCYIMNTHGGLREPSVENCFDSLAQLKGKIGFQENL